MEFWIYIERENSPKDLMVGPYDSLSSAEFAMNNSNLMEALCQEDCIDCYVTEDAPKLSEQNIVEVDLADSDHTGVGGEEDDAVLKLLVINTITEES